MPNQSIIRFWEIDVLRGIAIVMMIVFHILYDLNYLNILNMSLYTGYFLIYVYLIGILFFLLVGISLTLSYTKAKESLTKKKLKLKFLKRGLKIFGLGLLITLVTWLYLREGFIVFGVLHCIGLSIILAYPFLNLRYYNLLFGSVAIFLGLILRNLTFDFQWLVWLGFKPDMFYTIDYFPLFPWFGIILLGIFLGNTLYTNHKRKFELEDLSRYKIVKFFMFLGQHSLIIYFIHQPILLSIFYLFLTI